MNSDRSTGRLKFPEQQWDSFKAPCEESFGSSLTEIRHWLYKCLQLRDASQGARSHTGLMPHVMCPVIGLWVRAAPTEKTLGMNELMWLFVRDIAGLWLMGVFMTSGLRGKTMETGSRRWVSYQLRHKLEAEESNVAKGRIRSRIRLDLLL